MRESIETIEEVKPKQFLKILSIIILFLVVVYFLLYPFGFQIVESFIINYKIKDNIINFKDNKVIFEKEIYNELKNIYYLNERDEFKLCLMGVKVGNLYFINKIFKPKTYSANFNEVVAERCPNNTLIDLHKHPFRHCIFSEQDINSYNLIKKENDKILMIVMCEEGRFNFYDGNI